MKKTKMNRKQLVGKVARVFESKVKAGLSKRLHSFYIVGSFAFGKISEQRPDINFLLIFDKFTSPQDYLLVGKICREIEKEFSKDATVKIEFRPFRYIKPRYKNEFDVSINPILISTGEIQAMGGVIFNKWFTEGLKSANKLLLGKDHLKDMVVSEITREDLIKGGMFDLMFFTIPLSRAPAQYEDKESNLLLNESLINAKNIAFFGIEAAMSEEELAGKKYIDFMKNKEKISAFYKERYSEEAMKMVKRIFQIRDGYLKFKDDPKVAKEVFTIALNLGNLVRKKLFSH